MRSVKSCEWCVFFLAFAWLPAVTAQEVTDAGLADRVEELVLQLDDDQIQRRQDAEQALIELGAAALEHLPADTSGFSPEVRVRLARVQQQLQMKAAEAANDPSRVSISATMRLSQALGELQTQSGNQIVDFREQFGEPSEDPEVELDLQEVPFWQALDLVCDQSDTSPYMAAGQPNTVGIVSRAPEQEPAAGRVTYHGIFRVEPTLIQATRDLRMPRNEVLQLTLEISWEPRITPIAVRLPLDQVRANDDNQQKIFVAERGGVLESSIQPTLSSIELDIPLNLPRREAKSIQTLAGTLQTILPGPEVTFRFDQLNQPEPIQKSTAGVQVTLEQVRKNLDVYDVRILVSFPQVGEALQSHYGWIYENEAFLLSADGEKVEADGLETTRQTPEEVGLSYKFALEEDLSGYTFVYITPAAVAATDLQFELTNVDLP